MTDWCKQLQRLDGAYSEHTLSSYQSDFGRFAQWCRRHRTPFLPASVASVASYLGDEGKATARLPSPMRAQRSDRNRGFTDPALAGRWQIKRHLRRDAVAGLRAAAGKYEVQHQSPV